MAARILAIYHRAETFGGSFNSVKDVLSRADDSRVRIACEVPSNAPAILAGGPDDQTAAGVGRRALLQQAMSLRRGQLDRSGTGMNRDQTVQRAYAWPPRTASYIACSRLAWTSRLNARSARTPAADGAPARR